MKNDTEVKKTKRVKLDLVRNSDEFVKIAQQECRTWEYDVKKIMARLNCSHAQAVTLVALAQIADVKSNKKAA